ncbi:MAG: S41 family peptidase [Sphingobacteriia bacterium]|nr:S41 family peptidase [Sphingobacteriia bacterium]
MRIRPAFIRIICLSILGGVVFFTGFAARSPADNYFEISKNIDIFGKMYREINAYYVDEVEPSKFMRIGIDAMLASLDPFTNFISAAEIEDYRFISTGQYSGIGASISRREGEKSILITEVYEGFPAQTQGLRPGDEILKIDQTSTENTQLDVAEVRNLLRGQAKSTVKLTIRREGTPDPFVVEVIRDDIKVKNVPYYGMADAEIGYIQLTGFSAEASAEVKAAFDDLRKKNPALKGIILDLRENPGGLLMQAVAISNIFVSKNEKIVETRGRMEGSLRVYAAEENPLDTVIPLTVLINANSASASEIVSGVMQDLDRGIVIGQRSYGKGLVQNSRPLSYNTQIKLTTAKYYTPSGRCIQAIDYSHRKEDGSLDKIPDSLMSEFKTRRHRSVYDGGGIAPDVEIKPIEYHKITQELARQFVIFDFATAFHRQHQSIASARDFVITDDIYNEFKNFVTARKFSYITKAEKELQEVKDILQKEGYEASTKKEMELLENNLKEGKKNDIDVYRNEIQRLLRAEIVGRYYYRVGRLESSFTQDAEVKESIALLQNPVRYYQLLNKPLNKN